MTTHDANDDFAPGLGNIPPAALEDHEPERRRRWPWIVGAVVIGLAGLVAAGPSLLSTSWLNDQVRQYLNENLEDGTAVDFAQLTVSWSEGIRLEGLQLRRSVRDKHPLLDVPLVEFDADVWPLLLRRLDVRKFVFHDPVVRIERTRDGALNTEDVVKTKKKTNGKNGSEEESVIYPPIDVPVEVRGLTLVIVGEDGREAERGGIEFSGHLTTRNGPTTFALRAPAGSGKIVVDGTLALFDADGVRLAPDAMTVKSVVVVEGVDAKENQDLLSLFLETTPAAGVLDAHVSVDSVGEQAKGELTMTLRGLAVGGAARSAPGVEDVRVTAAFERDGERFAIRDGRLKAEGLDATANVSGTVKALDGSAAFRADLARSAPVLRALGVDVPAGVGGRLDGEMTFRPTPSRVEGRLEVDALSAPAAVEGGAPLVVDRLVATIVALPGVDAVTLESVRVEIPDELVVATSGTVGHDGALELATQLRAVVPAVMQRAKAMALAPQDLAIAGTVEGRLAVRRAAGAATTELAIDELALRDEGVLVRASGTVDSAGAVQLSVDGEGSLERLLAAGGADERLAALKGTFSFAATASGPKDALAAELKSLRLDGDLAVAAAGKLRPDGRISGDATVDGRIPDAVALARGLGFVEGDIPLDGRIHASVQVAGTRERFEVPKAVLRIDDGPLDVHVAGAVSDLGTVEGSVEALLQIDALLRVAHAQGFLAREHASGGTIRLLAAVAGTRDKPEVPSASVTVSGPLSARADGSYDADGAAHLRADFAGDLGPLLALAAAARGEDVQSVSGAYEGAVAMDGPPGEAQVHVTKLLVRSEGLTVDATAALRPSGDAETAATIRGPLEGAFALAHGFGQLAEVSGTGNVDVTVDARTRGEAADRVLTASVAGTLADVVLLRAETPDARFAEQRLTFAVPQVEVPLGDAAKAAPRKPITFRLETASGLRADARVLGGTEGEPVDLDAGLKGPVQPLLDLSAVFSGGGAGIEVGGSIETKERLVFRGDVSAGREHADTWTGGCLLAVKDIVAPYTSIPTGTVRLKIAGGQALLDPIDIALNGGTAQGTATLGLVGEKPEHALRLTAKDVRIDADLAPLLSRAAPLLAVGDAGDAGGVTGLEVELSAKGLDADRLKRSVTGQGTMHMKDVFAESRNWIAQLLEVAGAGARLEVPSADVPFTVQRGQVVTERFDLSGSALDLRLGGQVGLDGSIDYALGLKPKRDSDVFAKYAKLLDADGYLPLRLEGDLASPSLKLPSLTDTIKSGLGGLLEDTLKRQKEKEEEEKRKKEQEEEERRRRREERKKRKQQEDGGAGDPGTGDPGTGDPGTGGGAKNGGE